MHSAIPKRIIQTGKSIDLPLLSKAAVANARLLNPDFKYLFFDNKQVDEFINEQIPEYQAAFNSFRFPIQRYDFFRYLAIYHFGGFYLDLDVFLAFSLADLMSFGCVFPFEELTMNIYFHENFGIDYEIGNYAFGASPGHPFIKAIIDNCVRAQTDPKWIQPMVRSIPRLFRSDYFVFNTTGPGLVTRTLAEYPDAEKQIKVLFPEDVCDSKNWHLFGKYGIHLQEGTWRKPHSILRRRMNSIWESGIRKKLLKKSLRMGEVRALGKFK